MYQLNNHILQVSISSKGAELQSIFHLQTQREYMWSGDPAYWSKKSPVLFPVVGGLKHNNYQYLGVNYTLPRHGFAREREFTVTAHTEASITFTLEADPASLAVYPFLFRFSITYVLNDNRLTVNYLVENMDKQVMFFSVGAHPAFAVPMNPETEFSDYHLLFEKKETEGRWPLSDEGLLLTSPTELLHDSDTLPISKSLFYRDALVFKNLQSTHISILSEKNPQGLKVRFEGFPFMGIWSARDAGFVCIEPWCGIADSVDAGGDITQKEGINQLEPDARFQRSWSVEVC